MVISKSDIMPLETGHFDPNQATSVSTIPLLL
jgi:hypothetical protein